MRTIQGPVAGLCIHGEARRVPKETWVEERPQSSCNFMKSVKALRAPSTKTLKKFAAKRIDVLKRIEQVRKGGLPPLLPNSGASRPS
jgi:hypothetical protein